VGLRAQPLSPGSPSDQMLARLLPRACDVPTDEPRCPLGTSCRRGGVTSPCASSSRKEASAGQDFAPTASSSALAVGWFRLDGEPSVYLWMRGPLRPGSEDLDAKSIRIEDEEGVVARDVAVLLRRVVDPITPLQAPLMSRVDLLAGVDLERQVFEPDAVVAMGAAVGGTKAEPFVTEAQIDGRPPIPRVSSTSCCPCVLGHSAS